MDYIQAAWSLLEGVAHDPLLYTILFFLYAVAATVFLPIPVEFGLFLSSATPVWITAIVLGLGKMTGAAIVFYLGGRIGETITNLRRWRFFAWFLDKMHWFVAKTRYVGLYLILSTPLMLDTVPLYLFSLFNEKGVMRMRYFALTNFLAGVTRATIIYVMFYTLGIQLI